MLAIQDQVIATRNYKKCIIKDPSVVDDNCRKCYQQKETIDHITSGCRTVAGTEYTARYNSAAKVIHQELATTNQLIENNDPYYNYAPTSVLENIQYKPYWDVEIAGQQQIDRFLLNHYSNNIYKHGLSFGFKEITREDIYTALKSIKSQATGIDNISIKMISIVLPYCVDEILNIYNEIIRTGLFPDIWKIADVAPLQKKSSPTSLSDLRPISVLPGFAKLFEKIINDQIVCFVEKHTILPEMQSGFRKMHGTQSALLKHGLRINSSKTLALCIGATSQSRVIEESGQLSMNNESINWVNSAKNLGVYFDSGFTFSHHVDNICRKSFFELKSLYHFKKTLNEDTKLLLLQSLIYPHLEYCSCVYYNYSPQYNKNKLQRIQNACMRFVYNIPYREHISPYLLRKRQLNIEKRVQFLFTMFLYKLLVNRIPSYLLKFILRRSDYHDVNIRTNSFTIPKHNTDRFKGSFSYLASFYLNQVLNHLHLPISSFKKMLYEKLLKQQEDEH
nr:unnamed protein product [Callosobruchus analis]